MNKAPQAFTDSLSNSNSSPIVTTATPPTQLPYFHSLAPSEFTACFQHLPNHYLRPLRLHLKPTFLPPLHHSTTPTPLPLSAYLTVLFCLLLSYFILLHLLLHPVFRTSPHQSTSSTSQDHTTNTSKSALAATLRHR